MRIKFDEDIASERSPYLEAWDRAEAVSDIPSREELFAKQIAKSYAKAQEAKGLTGEDNFISREYKKSLLEQYKHITLGLSDAEKHKFDRKIRVHALEMGVESPEQIIRFVKAWTRA